MDYSTPGFPALHYLLESVETCIHWVNDAIQLPNHLILCCLFLLLSLIFPSIRIFSNELVLRIRWPKYWGFSFSISPSNEYSGLISFRIDFFDIFAVQGILKSLLQHSLKASILPGSAFFLFQFSHLYMTTRKTITLTVWIFVGKMMPLLFNMLSRFVIAFLPRSKCFLISWLQPPSPVILEPKKTGSCIFILLPQFFLILSFLTWWSSDSFSPFLGFISDAFRAVEPKMGQGFSCA